MRKLKYLSYSVVLQEVPDEISLAINISDCPYKCKGCHSKALWEYNGSYLIDDIDILLDKYDGLISCVCFMGGDQNKENLITCLDKVKSRNLKTCLYTGNDSMENLDDKIINKLDFIKIGRYIKELGGLNCKTTNQKMYNLKTGKEIKFYKN